MRFVTRQEVDGLGITHNALVAALETAFRASRTGEISGRPMTAADLAKSLPKRGWRTISWRDGTNAPLVSRFARVRVHASGQGTTSTEPEEWLIVEWPKDEKEPAKFWLSTLAQDIDFEQMIDITMMRCASNVVIRI